MNLKVNDKIICQIDFMMPVYDLSNSKVETFALVREFMEGKLTSFINEEFFIINFYGTSVVAESSDFEQGLLVKSPVTHLRLVKEED